MHTAQTPPNKRVKATRGALALGIDINTLYRRIQRREIVGGQDERGKWWVDLDSLNAALRRSAQRALEGALGQ